MAQRKILINKKYKILVDEKFFDLQEDKQQAFVKDIYDYLEEKYARKGSEREQQLADQKPSTLGAFGHGALQGASFGFSDELRGGIAAAPSAISNIAKYVTGNSPNWDETSEIYNRQRNLERDLLDNAALEHPIATTTGNIAGGIGSAFIPVGGPLARGALTLPKVAATGAAFGGLDAIGRSTGQTKSDALYGTVLGSVGGPALHYGIELLRPLGGYAATHLSKTGRAAMKKLKDQGVSYTAAKHFGRELDEAGIGNISEALADKGPGTRVLDLDPRLTARAEDAAVSGLPEAENILTRELTQRSSEAPQRIYDRVNEVVGQPRNYEEYIREIQARRAAETAPLYEAAQDAVVPIDSEFLKILQTPAMKSVDQKADTLRLNLQEHLNNGGITVRDLHLRMQELGDDISVAKLAGRNNEARALTQIRNQLRSKAEELSPEFKDAQRIYAEQSKILDAAGMQRPDKSQGTAKLIFDNNVTPEKLRNQVAKMSYAEKEALQARTRQELRNRAGSSSKEDEALIGYFQTPYAVKKLRIILGDEDAIRLLDTLKREEAFKRVQNQILGGSQTARRQARQREDFTSPKELPNTFTRLLRRVYASAIRAPYNARQIRNADLLSLGSGERTDIISRELKRIRKLSSGRNNGSLRQANIGGRAFNEYLGDETR
ncbi:MAG: hypothetical protein JSC085_000998 [Candidatus Tokpelaia sp. JSC085]|nr:MAG: hypothetical protein JSC085_000998 [Candidatus Tokpelaia sp. JSC085]